MAAGARGPQVGQRVVSTGADRDQMVYIGGGFAAMDADPAVAGGGNLTYSSLAYYWQAISATFGPVQLHELKHFAGHHLYVTMGLPDRVVAVQLGHQDGGKLVRELYGHGDVGALEEIDTAIGATVVPLREASGQ